MFECNKTTTQPIKIIKNLRIKPTKIIQLEYYKEYLVSTSRQSIRF